MLECKCVPGMCNICLHIPQVLVKELVSQLVVLDNNAHPFYKPNLFIVSQLHVYNATVLCV